ncbi:hypothetical protein BJX66DRAFT_202559 [Aspergillus keveii]|uniref:Uncharacterized protein n=1 Tax=Aspergillus keveii TaxID=714993 RepID=A0ABR4G5D7_9EURO
MNTRHHRHHRQTHEHNDHNQNSAPKPCPNPSTSTKRTRVGPRPVMRRRPSTNLAYISQWLIHYSDSNMSCGFEVKAPFQSIEDHNNPIVPSTLKDSLSPSGNIRLYHPGILSRPARNAK